MSRILSCALAAIACVALVLTASADDAAKPSTDGWLRLFDGKTLSGWKVNERADSWRVAEGCIVCSGKRSHLFYVGADPQHPAEFQNFHFRAEVMTGPHSNSGIYIHTKVQDDGWPSAGYECQLNNSQEDPVRTGSIYHVVKNYVAPAKDNEWFTAEIIVQGKNIVTKVDGRIIVDFTEPSGVTGPRRLSKGTIAFQAHDPGSVVRFRNIMLKPLPDSPSEDRPEPPKKRKAS